MFRRFLLVKEKGCAIDLLASNSATAQQLDELLAAAQQLTDGCNVAKSLIGS
jgi:hypothetical protein